MKSRWSLRAKAPPAKASSGKSLNAACLKSLPVIFLVEDNGYAISVPVEAQTAGGSISRLTEGFPGLFRQEVDGTDFLASYSAMKAAAGLLPRGQGPALVHAHVIRPYSHSLSDDERLYKTTEERRAEAERDPVMRFPKFLVDEGILDRHALQRITHEIDEEVHDATSSAAGGAAGGGIGDGASLFRDHRPHFRPVSPPSRIPRAADDDGRSDQCHACARRCAATRCAGVRRRRGRLQARAQLCRSQRQRRRVQGDARIADRIRLRAQLQYADRGSGDCGPRDRHGDARVEAGGGDPVFRLHLAGDDADSRRAGDAALALERNIFRARQ